MMCKNNRGLYYNQSYSVILDQKLIKNQTKQGKRNRPTFDGKTIPHEITLAEVTQ